MPNTTDTVKAILTPGEFVIRKEAVDMIGVPTLEKLNDMPEAGGHSEIDRLIAQATLKNMTGMYGGGMVNAEQYGTGGMVNQYQNGGLMEMMHGGKAKKKKEMYGYQDGGQAYSQALYNTPLENSFAQSSEPGLFDVGSILSVSADQVGGEGGRRYYLGEGQSKMLNMARKKASMRARQKMASAPQDSIPAALVESYFEQVPEKEKGGFLKKLLGMQGGGAVQDSAMMQQEQPNPFVPFDQRPPSSGDTMSSIPMGMQQGDYMKSLRGELEMENEELTRDKMQNFLERLRLDSLSEKIERSPQDSMYYRNTPQQDYFMNKYREEMINPNYFPEGN